MDPLVSVIIPAFNRPQKLLKAIQSVLDQSYQNLEFFLVDDCSTEDISEAIQLVKQANQNYIRLEANSGPATARNAGAKSSQGKYLAFLDSDDYWLEEKIAKQVEYHESNPELLISQCEEIWYRDNVRVNPAKKHLMPEGNVFKQAVENCVISSSSVFMHKSFYEDFGGYDEKYRVCEDYALWLRITAKHSIGLLKEKLCVKHGGHKDQLSKSTPAMDKYRLAALIETLLEEDLNTEQHELVKKQIQTKATILSKGAKKRGFDYGFYDKIANTINHPLNSTNLTKSLKILVNY